jgi:hypothetical protein
MSDIGSSVERKKNLSDPLAHPVTIFAQEGAVSSTESAPLKRFAQKIYAVPKKQTPIHPPNPADVPPTINSTDTNPFVNLKRKLLKHIIDRKILSEQGIYRLFEKTR